MGLRTADSDASPFPLSLALAKSGILRVALFVSLFLWLLFFLLMQDQASLHFWATIPLLIYVGYLAIARKLPGPTPVDWAVGALIVVSALSVWLSVDSRLSAEIALTRSVAVVAFYAVYDSKALKTETLARILVLVALSVSLLALLNVVMQYIRWLELVEAVTGSLTTSDYIPPTVPRVTSVLGHPNALARLLNLFLPFALVLILRPTNGTDRRLGLVTLMVGSLALFFTLSRGGWIAAAVWEFILLALLAFGHPRRVELFVAVKRFMSDRTALVAGIATLLLALAGVMLVLAILFKPAWLFRATIAPRIEAASIAVDIARDHWLLGAGPGAYSALFDQYRGDLDEVIPSAHNLYAGLLAEVGFVGAVVIAIAAVVVIRSLILSWRTAGDRKPYVAATIAAIFGVLAGGLSDFAVNWTVVLIPLAITIGFSLHESPDVPRKPSSLHPSILPRLLVLALIPMTLAMWQFSDSAQTDYDRSRTLARDESQLQAATIAAIAASEADPTTWAYQLNAGVSLARQYISESPKGETNGSLLTDAIAYFLRAGELSPNNSLIQANLAMAYRMQGDQEQAVATAEAAIAFRPLNPAVYAVAASTFQWAGLQQAALDAYAAAIEIKPTLAQSPFWQTQPASIRAGAIAASGVSPCTLARHAALFGVYSDDLSALADQCAREVEKSDSISNRASLAMALAVLDREDEARALVAGVWTSDAADIRLLRAILIANDDLVGARRELLRTSHASREARWLLLGSYLPAEENQFGVHLPVSGDGSPLPIELGYASDREATGVDDFDAIAQRGASSVYFNYASLRGTPPIVIIPGNWVGLLSPEDLLGVLVLQLRDKVTSSTVTNVNESHW